MKDWPKTTRMGIGRRLEDNAFGIFEHAHGATNAFLDTSIRLVSIQEMSRRCDVISSYLRMSQELQIIPPEIYYEMLDEITVIGNQVGGLGKFLREKKK